MTYIAFGSRRNVQLFCEIKKKHASGVIDFHVINGAWDGSYDPWKGTLFPHRFPENIRPVKVLWKGGYPDHDHNYDGRFYRDYNKAMDWIQDRVSHPWLMRWRMILSVFSDLPNYRLDIRIVRNKPKRESFNQDLDDEIPF